MEGNDDMSKRHTYSEREGGPCSTLYDFKKTLITDKPVGQIP